MQQASDNSNSSAGPIRTRTTRRVVRAPDGIVDSGAVREEQEGITIVSRCFAASLCTMEAVNEPPNEPVCGKNVQGF